MDSDVWAIVFASLVIVKVECLKFHELVVSQRMQDSDDTVCFSHGLQSYALYITGDENATSTNVSNYLAKVSTGMLHSP